MRLGRLILLLITLIPASLFAQYKIVGTVLDIETNLPIPEADVLILDKDIHQITAIDGAFEFTGLETKTYHLKVTAKGYFDVTISANTMTPIKVYMKPNPIEKEKLFSNENTIPTINLSELDEDNEEISGVLTASRDAFYSSAAFTFGQARFRIRGLDPNHTTITANGAPINDLLGGRAFWSTWGGLNDVTRNQQFLYSLGSADFSFGGMNGGNDVDFRPSKQRAQTRIGYAMSNRSYRNRIMVTHSTGMQSNGWAFTLSGSKRWAVEGYQEGTFYDAYSYMVGVERKINDKHSLSLVAFGAPNRRGGAGAAVQELYDIAGSNYYNSFWGYQNGEKRNSRVTTSHQPVVMLVHDWNFNKKLTISQTALYQFGKYGRSALDWYNAGDPRPNYYRKLPSYIEDPAIRDQVYNALASNENNRQLDWDLMYNSNRKNLVTIDDAEGQTGNSVTGLRSNYVVEERRSDVNKLLYSANLQQQVNDKLKLVYGINLQHYKQKNFKVLLDLLGGDFYLDINRFIDVSSDPNAAFNDLAVKNDLVYEGDKFGYNYTAHIRSQEAWAQAQYSLKHWDFFISGKINNNSFFREGHMQNGAFPTNSLGESEKQNFLTGGIKLGATYKIDGRNYVFANGYRSSRAPFFRNSYIAPRTRDVLVPNLTTEKHFMMEAGYLMRSPNLKVRFQGYYGTQKDLAKILRFYSDFVDEDGTNVTNGSAFGNYIMTGIDTRHIGTEIAVEGKISPTVSISGVAAIGQNIYDSRPSAYVVLDDKDGYFVNDRTIYMKDYYLSGPQQAYTLGFSYRSPRYWFVYLNLNHYRQMWLDFNPERRTERAVQQVGQGTDKWNEILAQEQLENQVTVDLFGGKSWRVGNKFFYFNLGINNLLNNQNFITGGYEQLRFEPDGMDTDVNRYPQRYYYLFGRNFFASLTYRF